MISADGSSCIPCSGIGAVLTDDVCTCGENAENNDGICECEADFTEWIDFHRCRPACVGLMNEFDQAIGQCKCLYEDSHVEGDDCLCDDGFLQHSNNTGCILCATEGRGLFVLF